MKIGIIGALGLNGALVSAGLREGYRFVGFHDGESREKEQELIAHLQKTIDLLKKEYGVEVVVLTIHGGEPEDTALARGLVGLDIIIAGHTHQVYRQLRRENGVFIAQAGFGGRNLGRLDFQYNGALKFIGDPSDVTIDIQDSVPVDPEMMAKIETWEQGLDSYGGTLGYQPDETIFYAKKPFLKNTQYGNMICSEILQGLHSWQLSEGREPTAVYMSNLSLIRAGIQGEAEGVPYLFSDVFKILPLGFDKDLNPGSPVVHFYLSKSDLRKLINFSEFYHMVRPHYFPSWSNSLTYRVRGWGIPFINRVHDLQLKGKVYGSWPEIISVATSSYFASFIPKVKNISYGLVNIRFRDRDGNVIAKPEVLPGQREFKLFAQAMKGKTLE